jgi:signal transduction histidine kinase
MQTETKEIRPRLSAGACRHINRMLAVIAPVAENLERSLATRLLGADFDESAQRALLACSPAAACRFRNVKSFLLRVEQSGRDLARMGVPSGRVQRALAEFDLALAEALEHRFEPPREQLTLAISITLSRAYYEVSASEAQKFLDLYRAELQERIRLDAEVRRLEAEARKAEEDERRRIGRELHDEACQSMALLRLQLELLERSGPPDIAAQLRESRAIVERTVEELRRIVAALSPSALERLGLRAALHHLGARFRKTSKIAVAMRFTGLCDSPDPDRQEVVYRVAQECLNNVAKHARASAVTISLRVSGTLVRLRVKDNGVGFPPKRTARKALGFGISGMRERAALLDGWLEIETARGQGTSVTLSIPSAGCKVEHNAEN